MNSNNDFTTSRYARFVPLPYIGYSGMNRIRKSKATVVGCGGLGSVTAFQLVALGIGHLRIIDNDKVERTNLQRQTLYREKDIGKSKAIQAKKYLEELNPDVKIEAINEEITSDNIGVVSKDRDFILDAVDSFATRFLLNNECLKQNIPLLFGAVSGSNGNAMTISRNSTCLECLFGNVKEDELPTTSEVGIHPSIIQIIGNIQVAEATRIMIDKEPLLQNVLLFCDIENMQFEKITVKPNSNCHCQK